MNNQPPSKRFKPWSSHSTTAEVMFSPRDRVHSPDEYHCNGVTVTGNDCPSAKVITEGERALCADTAQVGLKNQISVNSVLDEVSKRCENNDSSRLFFHVNYSGIEDNFVNSILHANAKHCIDTNKIPNVNTDIFHKWHHQSAFNFSYIPLRNQLMPVVDMVNDLDPLQMHYSV